MNIDSLLCNRLSFFLFILLKKHNYNCYEFLFRFMPIIEPIIPDNNRDMYEIINLMVNGFFVMIEIVIDNIM